MSKVDSKCLKALKKFGWDKGAEALAEQIEEFGAAIASTTIGFLKKDEQADAEYMAELTLTVRRAE